MKAHCLLGTLLLLSGCGAALKVAGYPPEARREAPPEGIELRALEVGKPAPAFTLSGSVEAFASLEALQKGPLVVVFYRGDWCPYCRTQLQDLQKNLQRFESQGVQLVALSVDGPDKAKALSQKLALAFPVLSDPGLETIRAFGVEDPANGISWPAVFLISADGTVRWRTLSETYKRRPQVEVILDALAVSP